GLLPSGWEYRLPTEAQWEYACRAGTTTSTAFGDKLNGSQANFDGEGPYNGADYGPSLRRTAMVGSYPANAWGLCDMHGNVGEWCRDWYEAALPGGADPELTTQPAHGMHVLRGGSWVGVGVETRTAVRKGHESYFRHPSLGLRVAIVRADVPLGTRAAEE